MNKQKLIVIDSDAIFALYNLNDPLNARARQTLQQLASLGYQLIYPTSVLFEVVSLFQRVLPSPTITSTLTGMVKNDELTIYVIDVDTLKAAAALFNPAGSKKNTLVDCSVATAAKSLKASGVFSFDNFYKKQGLKLASELI